MRAVHPPGDAVRWLCRAGLVAGLLALGLVLSACDRGGQREQPSDTVPPPGARMAIRPDSAVILVLDPHRMAAVTDDQRLAWLKDFPEDPIIGTPIVALDSTVFVLTKQHIHAVDKDGKTAFSVPHQDSLKEAASPDQIRLVAMTDSSLVACDGSRECVMLDKQGKEVWRYELPSDAALVDVPAVGPSGSLYLRSADWLYVVSNQGELRWRMSINKQALK